MTRPLPPHGGEDGPLIGALFAGYGGLERGVSDVWGGRLAWYAEFDGLPTPKKPKLTGAAAIMAKRFPGVPNLGDVTAVDWASLPPVDVITGGSPCQDLSHAGRRAGMTEGTRSNLWVAMREAIRILRPSVVVWENVRGAFSAEADSDLVADPRLLADVRRRDGEPVLRALGRVLGDFSELGLDARWHGIRAADVGAPHGRYRVFALGTDPAVPAWWEPAEDADVAAGGQRRLPAPGQAAGGRARPDARRPDREGPTDELTLLGTPRCADAVSHDLRDPAAVRDGDARSRLEDQIALLGTPTARMWKGSGQPGSASHDWLMDHGNVEAQVLALPDHAPLLPTPAVNDMGASYTPEEWDAWTERMKAAHGNGNGHGASLSIEAQRLLPTPSAALAAGGQTSRSGDRIDEPLLAGIAEAATEGRLLPTPNTQDAIGAGGAASRDDGRQAQLHDTVKRLLPTPAANDALGTRNSTAYRDPDRRDAHTGDTLLDAMWKLDGVEDPRVTAERDAALLLPTPRATDGTKGGPNQAGSSGDLMLPSAVQPDRLLPTPLVGGGDASRGQISGQYRDQMTAALARWGDYAPAILRWTAITGVPAPDPTAPSKKGNPQLSPRFVEWMMGLPAGWVTDVDITRNEMLKALGNGVVWQQASTALRTMLSWRLP